MNEGKLHVSRKYCYKGVVALMVRRSYRKILEQSVEDIVPVIKSKIDSIIITILLVVVK